MGFDKTERQHGALIFDLDGTLVDTAGDIVFSVNHIRRLLGLSKLDTKRVLSAVGRGAPYLLAELTGISKDDIERMEEMRSEFRRHYLEHQTKHSKLYPGIRRALENLSSRYDLFVLSNKPHPAVLGELNGQGISSFFKHVWGGGSLAAMKPDPIGIETVIETDSYPRDRVLMIGDMAIDIETAANAGVKSCFVAWGFGSLENGSPKPDITVDEVTGLVPAIDKLLATSY
jgi:phosphoglycolate phosphatase